MKIDFDGVSKFEGVGREPVWRRSQNSQLLCRVRSKVRIELGLFPDPMCQKWSVQKKKKTIIILSQNYLKCEKKTSVRKIITDFAVELLILKFRIFFLLQIFI